MMKTFRLIGIALMAILLSVTACSDGGEDVPEPEKPKSEIKIDSNITTNGISFSEKAEEYSVSFSVTEKWTLGIEETRSGTSWITPSATSGDAGDVTVTFKVSENTDYEDRSAAITIKAGTESTTFNITQKGVDVLADSVTKEGDLWIVTKSKAGNLQELLNDDMLGITSLKITGALNGDDIKALRQMLGGSEFDSSQSGKLNTLDLTDASIVEGGDYYYHHYYKDDYNEFSKYNYTKNNEIGDYMFYYCKDLQSIQLPNSVTTIGEVAFWGCSSLTNVTIGESVTTIGGWAFQICSSLTNVTISNSVTVIGCYAFSCCSSLTNMTIPNNVTSIGEGAFNLCI